MIFKPHVSDCKLTTGRTEALDGDALYRRLCRNENHCSEVTQPDIVYMSVSVCVCMHSWSHIFVHLHVYIPVCRLSVSPAEFVQLYLITDKRQRLRVEGVSRIASYFSSAAAGRISIFVPITKLNAPCC